MSKHFVKWWPEAYAARLLRDTHADAVLVNGADPGPCKGLDVQTWIRRIVTTGASRQGATGRC